MTGPVAITGATGFVGRSLLAMLAARGVPAVALVRHGNADLPAGIEQRIIGSLEAADETGLVGALAGCGALIHLAGIAHIGTDIPASHYDAVNHLATVQLARAAIRARAGRMVFMSSIRAVTGPSARGIITEDTPARPTDAYGAAKLAAEHALADLPIDHVILRPVLIIGRQARGNLALLDRLAATGLPLPFGRLTAQRALVAVDDVCRACLAALETPQMARGTFILAHPRTASVRDMVEAMRQAHGLPPRLFACPPQLVALALRTIGRGDAWERLAAPLVCRSTRLPGLGFAFRHDPLDLLAAPRWTLQTAESPP